MQARQGSAADNDSSRSMEELLVQARPLTALAALLKEEDRAGAAACRDGSVCLPEEDAATLVCRVRGVALASPHDSQVGAPGLVSPQDLLQQQELK